ncbi:MAG: tetraacyldisaccharide 4'-kinase, partial [Candidatus Delongbacteria bacterium]|nr:tetraacyldisaccharide 4'-kinase [Candidatus Delongbacteria bacterium]MCG2760061.1 tetraacyldisaccharide 4'-kinase [Candidatus Delongbacteria bacterium]
MLFPKNPYLSLLISFLLLPITFIYFIVVAFRHILYDSGIIKSFKPNVFTVSIGNITVGGTGKTPTVINMVNSLSVSGLNPLIVTRGYGRKTKCRVVLNETTSASDSGDEALTIYRKTKKSVVCDINRSSAIKDMGKYYDLIVLDDAFQHRKVKKDLDIVLIDESRFLGNHLLLPS